VEVSVIGTMLVLLVGCGSETEALDLTERLGSGQVRAGVITDEAALFGGVAAEGQLGDLKLYNDRVAFIIQGARVGSYMSTYGGVVIDADIVRPVGELGRDAVQEWSGMAGYSRYLAADSVQVVADGADGNPAIVRAVGPEAGLEYLTGAFGLEHDNLGLELCHEYRLQPDSWLLEVRTMMTATRGTVTVAPGDVLQGAREVALVWEPGAGLTGPDYGVDREWTGWLATDNDLALAIMNPTESGEQPVGARALDGLMRMTGLFVDGIEIPDGETRTYTRYYGVAPDAATLTAALLLQTGAATETVSGTVTAADGPVAGARVHILVDGEPWTQAATDADGGFSTLVPAGASITLLADGRGTGFVADRSLGGAAYAPYSAEPLRQAVLERLGSGTQTSAVAVGRGVADASDPLTLGVPATLLITSSDGGPFEVLATGELLEDTTDPRLVYRRPSHATVQAWSADGELELAVEPGTYEVVVHRGVRFETHVQTVTLAAGQTTSVVAVLEQAYDHPGWLQADPHSHASPSSDGEVTMETRLLQAGALGLQLHFGTDHDHIADYNPLLGPLGLEGWLGTVVASESSPFLQGHHNLYPLISEPEAPNGGAWIWYNDVIEDTQAAYAQWRTRHPAALIQVNHPMVLGLAASASWETGEIAKTEFWSTDFDVIEVMNDGDLAALDFYIDMLLRGHLAAPVGTSDAHGAEDDMGLSSTFLDLGLDDPRDVTDEAIVEVFSARRMVISRGPWLDLSISPGSVITQPESLEVEALSPSWIQVDRLVLYQDGQVVETVEGTTASFALDPVADAAFWVVAEGETGMAPVWADETPWAMSSPILVDLDGDGWDPPLPPLQ
jgi:hypothetical protein